MKRLTRKRSRGASHWLMKTEPSTFSIDDLAKASTTSWEGVRNYQARNNMQSMNVGDRVLIYHSCASPPGVVGEALVCAEAHPDTTATTPSSPYFDPKSTVLQPRWFMVDVHFVEKYRQLLSLAELREQTPLQGMELFSRSRLSIQSVSEEHFEYIRKMAGGKAQ